MLYTGSLLSSGSFVAISALEVSEEVHAISGRAVGQVELLYLMEERLVRAEVADADGSVLELDYTVKHKWLIWPPLIGGQFLVKF